MAAQALGFRSTGRERPLDSRPGPSGVGVAGSAWGYACGVGDDGVGFAASTNSGDWRWRGFLVDSRPGGRWHRSRVVRSPRWSPAAQGGAVAAERVGVEFCESRDFLYFSCWVHLGGRAAGRVEVPGSRAISCPASRSRPHCQWGSCRCCLRLTSLFAVAASSASV